MNNMETLHDLGLKHNTDKATYHEYTKIYQTYLDHIRYEKLSVLEVGINKGASLNMWADYFINSKIYGADILDKHFLKTDRIDVFITNQEKPEDLRQLPKNLDLIIDDGGHTMLQQQLTFKILFLENLKNGGIYILEDLHTSLPKYFEEFESNEHNNTLQLLRDLKTKKISESSKYFITNDEFQELLENINSIELHYNGPDKDNSITSIIIKNEFISK
jgi:hypothetical protein